MTTDSKMPSDATNETAAQNPSEDLKLSIEGRQNKSVSAQEIEALLLELKQTWHQTIPVSQFMQVTPMSYDGNRFTVSAPMAPNINLHQTMFAGSIYTLMTLTGWGMLWLQQQIAGVEGNIVLADANIRYNAPITEAPIVTVIWPEAITLAPLATGGKIKVKLEVQLHCADKLCATFSGLYFSLA